MTVSASTTTPSIGSNVTFTIIVTNNGPNNATNVTVRDVLPAGLNYFSDDSGGAYNSGTGIWTMGNLPGGSTATLNLTATVVTGGTKTNWAEVWSADQVDPDSIAGNSSTTEDDDDSATLTVPVTGTLNITNTVNNPNPNVGANVVFTITVNNPLGSPFNATGVAVNALLPTGLTYVSHSVSPGTTYNNGTGLWTIGNLAIGSSVTLTVTAKVDTSGSKNFSAIISSNEFANNTATATVVPVSGTQADLSLSQTWNRSTDTADRVELKITVKNNDTVNSATNVQVKDLLPSGLTYVSHTSSMTYNSSTGIWSVGTLNPNSSSTLTIIAKVAVDGDGTTNFAEVWRSDQYDPDSTPANGEVGEDDDTSRAGASVPGSDVKVADLNLTQTVDIAGGNAVFRITVVNNGPDNASGITVKNSALIASYTYVSHAVTPGTTYASATGDWTIPALLDGASATLTVTTTYSTSLAVNWSQVSAVNEVDPDSVPGNCSNTIASCIEDDDASAPSADLSVTQTVSNSNPNVSDNVTFTITVRNGGLADTGGVQVRALLPSALTYVSDTGGGSYTKSSGIWTVGDMLNGASKTLSIVARVSSHGVTTNVAEVWKSTQDDPDSTPANSSTSEDDYAAATITSYRAVILNEIAWGGTAASAEDEWIELYNPSGADITLSGWKIRKNACDLSGTDYIVLASGAKIPRGGFFLLERGSVFTDNSTVSDVTADQIYLESSTPALSDSGEILFLCDNLNNFIDTANRDGGAWPQGSALPKNNYGSMERRGITAENDDNWVTNIGTPRNGLDANGNVIYGTPKRANSAGITPTPTTANPVPTAAAILRPIINEFLPRPGFDWNQDGRVDVFDEFIEIKNIGVVDVNLNGWELDDEADQGSSPFTLPAITLKPGERAIYYGLQTNILLGDGGDTVRLINPSGKIYDAYTYAIARAEDQSVCRLPDGKGAWYEDCVPTPNLVNSREGEVPSMPQGETFESPVCNLPDTLPADFLFAECRGYGADIWHSFFWDQFGWQGDRTVYQNMSKWESFVE